MKKLLIIATTIISLLYGYQNSFAAIAAATVWECRTTGVSTNGGGYSSGGTDYSQQDAAQYSPTDLANLSASTTLTSAAAGFTSAMVGNVIYIASGTNFIAGYYQITAYTNTSTVAIDRTANATLDASAGVGYVGGATNHPDTISAKVVAGNTIYIAGGTYNEVGANTYVLNTAVAGGAGTPIKWIGYKSGTARTAATLTDRPLFDATGVTNGIVADVAGNIFYNLRTTGATAAGITVSSTDLFLNCQSYSNGTTGFTLSAGLLIGCESSLNTTIGFSLALGTQVWSCYSHDNTTTGLTSSGGLVQESISESNSSHGFSFSGLSDPGVYRNLIAYGNTGAAVDGVNSSVGASGITRSFINCIFATNGRYGFNTVTSTLYFNYNCYNGNGTAGLNGITGGANDTTADPLFTAPTANPPDFTVSSSSPVLGVGFPDANWAVNIGLATGAYKQNIGVDQDDNTAAGAGGGRGARFINN